MSPADMLELAERLAEIARQTTDPKTGVLVMGIVDELLTAAGLPHGGGQTPPSSMSEAMFEAEYA